MGYRSERSTVFTKTSLNEARRIKLTERTMPQVELCCFCEKEVDTQGEKFVVVNEKSRSTPREIAHIECFQKRPKEPPRPLRG